MATYSFTDLNNETRFVGTLATVGTIGPTDPAPLNATSPVGTITSGALPTVSPSSGTALQVSTARDVTLALALTYDASAADATCKVELSPNNSDFSTLATTKIPNATNPANGEVQLVSVRVPAAWWVKLTLSHVTVTSAVYY
jgi:hypothetical protein